MNKQIFNLSELQKLLKRYGYYFLPVLALLIAISSFTLMAPRFFKIFTIREDIKAKEVLMGQMEEKLGKLQAMDFQKIEEEVGLAAAIIPDQKKITEVMLNMKILSDEEKIFVEEISVSPGQIATESAGVEEIAFSMHISGPLENFKNFFQRILKMAPAVAVDSVEMNLEEETWEVDLAFATFFSSKELRFRPDSALPELSERGEEMKEKMADFEALYLRKVGEGPVELVPFSSERDIFSLP